MSDTKRHSIQYISIMIFICLLVSLVIKGTIWLNYPVIVHSFLELLCVFMALMIFVLTWFSYEKLPAALRPVGFYFIAIAILLIIHIIHFPSYNTLSEDLSLKYAILIRLIEAFAFFSFTSQYIPKWKKDRQLIATILFCFLVILILNQYNSSLPRLYRSFGNTALKTGIEMFILSILIVNYLKITQRFNEKDIIGYKHIYKAILIAMVTIVSFIIQKNPGTLFIIFGHAMRIVFYYHLFEGVFVSAISHPYERLEEILDQLPLGVSTYDKDFRFIFSNNKAEEVTGYSTKMMMGLTDWDVVDKVYVDKKSNHIVRDLTTKHKGNPDVRTIIRRDGSPLKIVIEGFVLKSGGYLCVFDTARRIQALENMQLQTQAILDSISNFVVMINTEKRIVMCNRAFSKGIQVRIKDIIGTDVVHLAQSIKFSRSDLLDKKFSETRSNIPIEAIIETPYGERKDWLLHLAYIKNIEKEIIGYIAVGTDVTELKKQQEEVKQKEKLAILGQMASGIVHEIKNPVTAIMGFNQLLKMKAEDEKMNLYCQYIERELNRLNKIVSDFLLFAKPRSPVFTELSLNQTIESMNLLIDSYVFTRGVKIAYDFAEDVQPVCADKNQLEQVILNIVKNAVDAVIEVKEPLIRISTGYDSLFRESYIVIYNNGKALDQEQKQKIGTPFFTTKSHGTGLGLSICKQIIREHRGKMTIKSEEEWGTAFELAFPANV